MEGGNIDPKTLGKEVFVSMVDSLEARKCMKKWGNIAKF